MLKPVFHEWAGSTLREKDLPVSVRYKYPGGSVEYLAAERNSCVAVRQDGGVPCCYVLPDRRNNSPVIILDWPQECGPRPYSRPTFNQIRGMAPDTFAATVWLKHGKARIENPAAFYVGDGKPSLSAHFLGWITLEPSDE